MKILVSLTYYRPHVSGLTIYVERLARAWARAGHAVTILTSRYRSDLAREEMADGVRVLRLPVAMRISKGVLMPTIGVEATRLVLEHDVLSLHLPQFDAAGIAARGRLFRRPTVLTHHCDLLLPVGLLNGPAHAAVQAANHIAAQLADAVVSYTQDYAAHSPFLSRYTRKLRVIPPPVDPPETPRPEDIAAFASLRHGRGPVIGMAARLATEKGVEYLLEALPPILERHPEAMVLFAGQHENVLGEQAYARRLRPALERMADHWTFLGVLDPHRMSAFYNACDVTVLPSLNSTESFGLVQIESILCGTPVVAADLPGVRQPVLTTGRGKVVPIRDSAALAEGILEVLERNPGSDLDLSRVRARHAPDNVAREYLSLFEELGARRRP
ncbi:MAG TPA: glycosyltransferase family 4 protein [Anaerolineales bacterium]|nr:glycosyltransferase family 4 protein [Anaerolineales bacterium]